MLVQYEPDTTCFYSAPLQKKKKSRFLQTVLLIQANNCSFKEEKDQKRTMTRKGTTITEQCKLSAHLNAGEK